MEQLLDSFSSSCKISKADHPHFALYKAKSSKVSQTERRAAFLSAQKAKRFDYVAHARQLAASEYEFFDDTEGMEKDDPNDDEEMNIDLCPVKYPRKYKDQLMMSEWMIDVPEDLSSNWLLKFCPLGKRCLVVASRGITKAYSRGGYCLDVFPSSIPGGNKKEQSGAKASRYSLLDCIYNKDNQTYYVLDMICWNGHPLYDSECEFRFSWIHTKLKECSKAMEVSSSNPFKFEILPEYSCDANSLQEAFLLPMPFPCKLDGLLFFHKRGHYIPKSTPLACWLKGFMVPEVLNLSIPTTFLHDVPPSYTTMKNYLPKAFEENERQKEKDAHTMQVESP